MQVGQHSLLTLNVHPIPQVVIRQQHKVEEQQQQKTRPSPSLVGPHVHGLFCISLSTFRQLWRVNKPPSKNSPNAHTRTRQCVR